MKWYHMVVGLEKLLNELHFQKCKLIFDLYYRHRFCKRLKLTVT